MKVIFSMECSSFKPSNEELVRHLSSRNYLLRSFFEWCKSAFLSTVTSASILRKTMQIISLFIFTLILAEAQSLAVFDLQVFTGRGKSSLSFGDGENGSQQTLNLRDESLGLTGHVDPFSTIPIAIGLGFVQSRPVLNMNLGDRYRSVEANVMSLELMGWLPLNGYALYAKAGKILSGSYKIKINQSIARENGEAPIKYFSLDGYHVALGVGVPLAPGLGAFAEVRNKMGMRIVQVSGVGDPRLGLRPFSEGVRGVMKSANITVGFEMGI